MSYSNGNNSNDTITNIMSTPVRGHGGSGLASPNEFMNHNTSSTNRTSHHNNPNYNYYQGVLQLDSNYNSDTNGQEQAPTTTTTSQQQQQQQQAYMDALEDVHTRFILNLPDSELQTADRIFFQLEQAWWFYEDWICDPQQQQQGEESTTPAAAPSISSLPRFSTLKPFSAQMFAFSPLLPPLEKFADMWHEFSCYKRKISNYGCILLNADYTHVILCRLWDSKTWTFPSGKINQGEDGRQAAARETYEETGFDPHCILGSTRTYLTTAAASGQPTAVPWNYPLQEHDALSYQEPDEGKRRTCYVCCGVPEDFPFEPVCRKEVSKIEWFTLDQIPKPNYAVGPFLSQLKRWIKKYKKGGAVSSSQKKKKKPKAVTNTSRKKSRDRGDNNSNNKGYTTPRRGGTPSGRRTPGSSRPGSRQGSRSRSTVGESDALVEAGLCNAGELSGWSEEDMFSRNEQLLGRKIEYDGNPHQFAEQGFFGGQDPHAFHVVGGGFLNGGTIQSLAPPPQQSKLQPLFRGTLDSDLDNEDDLDRDLQPFFSDDGVTPWGELITEAGGAEAATPARTIPAASAVTPTTRSIQAHSKIIVEPLQLDGNDEEDDALAMFTDAEITRRSQATKRLAATQTLREAQLQKYQADLEYIQAWVAALPKPKPTRHFGEFKLDAAAMVEQAMRGLST